MKHSELSANQNNFGIQIGSVEINNKSFSLTEQGISVSNTNSNTLMINSVIPTHININSSAILNTTLNNQRSINLPDVKNYNLAILAKPNSSSSGPINSNLVSPLTFHPNNTIKLVNLSKCQQISNINKDNSNNVQSNTINVQFVSNTSNTGCNDSAISIQPNCKIDNISLNPHSLTTAITNQTSSTNSSSLAGTRFVIQGASPSFFNQGTLTFVPHTSDISNNATINNHLIKNPKYVFSGNKPQHQTIRPITSSVVSQSNISKQPISIISPSKTINNYVPISTLNMSDVSNQTVMQDLSMNHRGQTMQLDSQRCSKNTPLKIPLQSYSVSTHSNNNIRLALTSTINNSRVHPNQSKIQLISPKSRKRSGSPLNLMQDGKTKNQVIVSKDENVDNSINYNNQVGNYSPTRKRARKQHLKSVNNKSQKQIINQKLILNNKIEPSNHLNNIRPALNEKIMPTAMVIPTNTTKVSNITFQNKQDDNIVSNQTPGPINAQIIIGIKNPIQICSSKTSSTNQSLTHRPTSIFANNVCNTTIISSSTNNNNNNNININNNNNNNNNNSTTITPINQFQIISQNQNIKQIQLPSNFILSPKIKCQTSFSPSKVIHIAPSLPTINRTTPVKNEIVTTIEPIPIVTNEISDKPKPTTDKKEQMTEPIKLESLEIKSETSDDSNIKISLFPNKYHWNAKRNHFMKKSDVKFKKVKSIITSKGSNLLNVDIQEDSNLNSDVEMRDISWFLYKAFCQILMQKKFDEENLEKICQLKEKFEISSQIDDFTKPIFRKICAKTQFYTPIPDQIDINCLSKYTDPHLFGISEDITDNYINSLTKNNDEISEETFPNTQSHECSPGCILYSLEVPPSTQPQKFSKIVDLIEGLIVKERIIIEKESEINNQFLKFLRHTADNTSLGDNFSNKTNNVTTDPFKLLSGYRR